MTGAESLRLGRRHEAAPSSGRVIEIALSNGRKATPQIFDSWIKTVRPPPRSL